MKNILNLDTIVLGNGENLESRKDMIMPELESNASTIRIPIIFVIDRSGSMSDSLNKINEKLNEFSKSITEFDQNRDMASVIDLAIIAFDSEVKVIREFGLLKKDEKFKIESCSGRTALGEAMMCAYVYGQKRKQRYKEEDFGYRQPLVVLLTDFDDFPPHYSHNFEIDGNTYRKDDLYDHMCELYVATMRYNEQKTQYTFAVPMGEYIASDKLDRLKGVAILKDENGNNKDLTEALNEVFDNYKASVAAKISNIKEGLTPTVIEKTTSEGSNPKLSDKAFDQEKEKTEEETAFDIFDKLFGDSF